MGADVYIGKSLGRKRNLWSVGVGEWQPTSMVWGHQCGLRNIDAALYLMDYMYSEEGFVVTNWGTEGETYGVDENGDYYMLLEFVSAVQNGEVTMQKQTFRRGSRLLLRD